MKRSKFKKLNNISTVVDKYLCNSCGVCYSVCKNEAIYYHETGGGYIFPKVQEKKCNGCGICLKVCPGLGFGKTLEASLPSDPFTGNVKGSYIGKATDSAIFNNSQSGGVATAIVKHLFETGKIQAAILTIMKKEIPPRGDVLLIRSERDLAITQKSKYTPIPILKAIKELEQTKEKFAIVGLSCHIHGLFNYLDLFKHLQNCCMAKIGLICDRVLTTKALDFLISNHSDIRTSDRIVFRDKNKPSYPGNTVISTASGGETILPPKHRMRIKDFFTPARCLICFDKMNVFSDITIGDPHGIDGVDRVGGESAVIVRTTNGLEIINSVLATESAILREVNPEKIFKGQKTKLKHSSWSAYSLAWKKRFDEYPVYGHLQPDTKTKFSMRHDIILIYSIQLDKFKNRTALFKFVNMFMSFNILLRLPKIIFRKLCGF